VGETHAVGELEGCFELRLIYCVESRVDVSVDEEQNSFVIPLIDCCCVLFEKC